jgi:hypothetical protein
MQPVVDVGSRLGLPSATQIQFPLRTGWSLISQFLEARGLFGQPLLKCLLMFDAMAIDGQWPTAPAL